MVHPKQNKQSGMPSVLKSIQRSVVAVQAAVEQPGGELLSHRETRPLIATGGSASDSGADGSQHNATPGALPPSVASRAGSKYEKMKFLMDKLERKLEITTHGDTIGFRGRDKSDAAGKKFRVQIPKRILLYTVLVFVLLPIAAFLYILITQIFGGGNPSSRYHHDHGHGPPGHHPPLNSKLEGDVHLKPDHEFSGVHGDGKDSLNDAAKVEDLKPKSGEEAEILYPPPSSDDAEAKNDDGPEVIDDGSETAGDGDTKGGADESDENGTKGGAGAEEGGKKAAGVETVKVLENKEGADDASVQEEDSKATETKGAADKKGADEKTQQADGSDKGGGEKMKAKAQEGGDGDTPKESHKRTKPKMTVSVSAPKRIKDGGDVGGEGEDAKATTENKDEKAEEDAAQLRNLRGHSQ